ncbi:MAG: hypothetical protein KBD14_00140, partial [Candidatus Pacebacteria bacterium]|nr:hypothetical protein [Candidatus Paceibacterota bacterium]
MTKKIFLYIVLFAFILIPDFSYAKIENVYSEPITPGIDSATLVGTIYQSPEGENYNGILADFKFSEIYTNDCAKIAPTVIPLPYTLDVPQLNPEETGLGIGSINVTKTISNLKPGTTYYFCLYATENGNKSIPDYSFVQSFKTKPSITLKADPTTLPLGSNVTTLTWNAKGATSCTASDGWSGNKNTSGTLKIQDLKKKTTFRLNCTNGLRGGETETFVIVNINNNEPNYIGKVETLPNNKTEEPELVVEVTDNSAKLKGILKSTTSDKNYAYFRISKVTIPPIFCNDIFGSNMIAVTATNQGGQNIKGGLVNKGEFSGTIYTLEPDTDYAYCAIVSNHPTIPTEIEYGQVIRFRTNPCVNCPHTNVRTLNPTKVGINSAILQGNYNSTRNIKVWFEYRLKFGGSDTPTGEGSTDTGGDNDTNLPSGLLYPPEKIFKNRILGININYNFTFGIKLIKYLSKTEIANALDPVQVSNEWHTIKDSETTYNKKRNYGRQQFTLTGLSRDTIYQYRIVAETIQDKILYPNPNPVQRFEGAIIEFKTKAVNDGTNPLAHCYNGIQDLGETGVDTGGGCPGKAPSCDDGIQNQNETSIDQGGVCKDKPIASCTNGIQDFGETDVDTGGPCEDPEAPDCPEEETCGCPPGTIGTYPDCIPPLPTCNDGIQNNGETGIDTGGFCDEPSCVDGIQNQNETGIDSGGVCEGAPDPCFNGIQDGDETGIDKGGSCGNDPRPNRCKNGIQDGDETGIDSGGSCGNKVTVDIKASPIYVVSPGQSNISWTSTNADTCNVTHINAESVVLANINKPSGAFKSINLNANANRTVKVYNYTATCTGKNGSATDTVSVFAFPKLETIKVNLKVEPPKGKKGDIATVSWTSTNATSCESTGGGGTGTSGSFQTEKLEKSVSYTVRCENKTKGIWGASTIFIYVNPANNDFTFENCFDNIKNGTETDIDIGPNCPDNKDKVTVDIKAKPVYVENGGRSEISWTSKNAEWCIISNYQQGKKVLPSGAFSLINITSNRTYSAVCGGEKGEGSDSVNIFVYPKFTQIKVDLVAEKSIVNKGETTRISWTSTNATSCESTGGGGTGTSGSFQTTTLNSSKTYSVTCKGGPNTLPGNDTQLVTVKLSNDNNGSGGNGSGSCPEGWLQEDNSCKPTYTCPENTTGIWPNCKYNTT